MIMISILLNLNIIRPAMLLMLEVVRQFTVIGQPNLN